MKYSLLALLATNYLLLTPAPAFAQSCSGQYQAACPPTDVVINKLVKNPSTNLFVENLTDSDAMYSVGSDVHFQLRITNTAGRDFSSVKVKDTFPEYMTFESGPGTYDASARTLTFSLDNLKSGETRTVELLGKVTSSVPRLDTFCETNWASVQAEDRSDDDSAQFCVTTKVLGAATLPVAGFDDWMVMVPFFAIGLIGFLTIRRAI